MIITQTPLRISFLGGGTDFPQFYREYGGCVLTTAIDKYVHCIVQKRFDDISTKIRNEFEKINDCCAKIFIQNYFCRIDSYR